MQYLSWILADQAFGMTISSCREVVPGNKITPVPHAPAFISGIVNIRGEVITVVDLRVLFGYQSMTGSLDAAIIRLKDGGRNIGLRADRISDVITVDPERIESSPAHLSELEARYISAIINFEHLTVAVLDASRILENIFDGSKAKNSKSLKQNASAWS